MDKYFRVELLRATPNPQQLCWLAMHQDYSPHAVVDRLDKCPNEQQSGEYIVKHCMKPSHFGILEHPQITINGIGFPHHTVMQIRTHRIGVSFDVQSFRYCGDNILDVAKGRKTIDEVFCLRKPGRYTDRHGAKYEMTEQLYQHKLRSVQLMCDEYSADIADGFSEEHARELVGMGIRQNFVASFNARSLLHVLDNRHKKDAQLEVQIFSDLLFQRFAEWMPQVAEWYAANRLGKNKLAP